LQWRAGSRAVSDPDHTRMLVSRPAPAHQESFVMQPVQRISKSRKRKRRSHHALTPIHYVRCPQCGNSKLPHCACDNCGYVNPKLALQVQTDES
jgi:large subunit ribosomal protein L32